MVTQPNPAKFRRGSRFQPEARRKAILKAALVEFAREGLAGARMDAIAEAARVNKGLLYYYFRDKETLYGAILDQFFEKFVIQVIAVCGRPGSAGERFLGYARTHFDAVAESPYYAHIFMSELMSASRGGSPHLNRIFARYMRPIGMRVLALVREGVKSGEFRAVDANQFVPSAIGSIVHWFLTAPLRQKLAPEMSAKGPHAIQQRRAAVLDFIAAALFADRDAGTGMAARIAAQPASTLGGEAVTQRNPRGQRAADSSPFAPAQHQTLPPPPVYAPDTRPDGAPIGYTWMDRWFPDVETAWRVLQEERKRHGKRKPKRPNSPRKEEGPQ